MQNRGILALAKKSVVVPSHVLSFDIFGVPYSEPAMASITRRTSNAMPQVHGVAYLISKADYERLLVCEGAGTAYEEIQLDAMPVHAQAGADGTDQDGNAKSIRVKTLVARYPFRTNAPPRPSTRYLVSGTTTSNFVYYL